MDQITTNFTYKELENASVGTFTESILTNGVVVTAWVQLIRDYLSSVFPNNKITGIVLSFYRSKEHEISKGRSGESQHTEGRAIDVMFLIDGEFKQYVHDVAYEFIERTFKVGGRAMNLLERFIHVDTRPWYATWNY